MRDGYKGRLIMGRRNGRRARQNNRTNEIREGAQKLRADQGHDPENQSPAVQPSVTPGHASQISELSDRTHEKASEAAIDRYTRRLSHWTAGLVLVGLLTAGILFFQYLTFEKTD